MSDHDRAHVSELLRDRDRLLVELCDARSSRDEARDRADQAVRERDEARAELGRLQEAIAGVDLDHIPEVHEALDPLARAVYGGDDCPWTSVRVLVESACRELAEAREHNTRRLVSAVEAHVEMLHDARRDRDLLQDAVDAALDQLRPWRSVVDAEVIDERSPEERWESSLEGQMAGLGRRVAELERLVGELRSLAVTRAPLAADESGRTTEHAQTAEGVASGRARRYRWVDAVQGYVLMGYESGQR